MRPHKPRDPPYWICDHCDSAFKTQRAGSTTNFLRHLNDKHKFISNRNTETKIEEEEEVVVNKIEEDPQRQYSMLCTTVNAKKF